MDQKEQLKTHLQELVDGVRQFLLNRHALATVRGSFELAVEYFESGSDTHS
jgi:hypothetical protein